ncbi:MAG: MarR family transcriptional regulator, partial [Nitrososphaera sp.]
MESDVPEKSTLKEEAKPEDSVKEKQVVSGGKAAQILVEEETLSTADFHNNDNKILSVLNEAGSNYSFKGLMRKLGLHQQSLSRALHRLEEMGLVERSPVGYRLSRDGSAVSRFDAIRPKGREYMQLLQTY